MTTAIGIDVGGSKTAACLVDLDRQVIVESIRVPTRADDGGEAVLAKCIELAGTLAATDGGAAGRAPLGIGVCELVSPSGRITSAATFDWRGVDLSAAFGSPVVVESIRVPTRADDGGEAVLARCIDLAGTLAATDGGAAGRAPLGIGVCELVSPSGRITSAATFDWRGVDLSAAFGSPVVVESDVRAAAIGEARLGAARGWPDFVYVTVGTGVAFSLVIGGAPYVGARGNALILGAPPVETTASGAALSRRAGTVSAEEAFELAEASDLVRDGSRDLGRALAWLVNALDPELLVIGGGLGLRDEYREAAVREMRAGIEASESRHVRVVPAALGADAGAVGVALLAAERSRHTSNR